MRAAILLFLVPQLASATPVDCTNLADGTICATGDKCTSEDYCHDGVCVRGVPLLCRSKDACHRGICDPDVGCMQLSICDLSQPPDMATVRDLAPAIPPIVLHDLAPPPDGGAPDLVDLADLARVDLASTDLASADLSSPEDLSTVDPASHDLASCDLTSHPDQSWSKPFMPQLPADPETIVSLPPDAPAGHLRGESIARGCQAAPGPASLPLFFVAPLVALVLRRRSKV